MSSKENIENAAKRIRLLLMDCDGVMTDGSVYLSADGEAMKVFNAKDGYGLSVWNKSGRMSGVITGRGAEDILNRRASEVGMKYVRTRAKDKVSVLREIIEDADVSLEETAFIGDDLLDLPVLRLVGFPAAVADAVSEVREAALFVTEARGGRGAVRELIDLFASHWNSDVPNK